LKYSLSIRKEAEADIAEAYQYYESCRENLGLDFMLCIEESFSRIQKNPKQYKVIYKNVHRALVKRFPYGVYYVVLEKTISVLSVMHARKNPGHWQARS
jgi:plasmid stabilization system protein ParE